jgi:hypothetical protein
MCTDLGGANSICMDPNAYWISFVSFNQGLSSITKKGEIESASRPPSGFWCIEWQLN